MPASLVRVKILLLFVLAGALAMDEDMLPSDAAATSEALFLIKPLRLFFIIFF
jgi:hypothetical protein